MKLLPKDKREKILGMLVEGMSMRSVSRLEDVSFNTVVKLLIDGGNAAADHHHKVVRNVRSKRVQCDEIWAFCYAKQKNVETAKAAPPEAGDVWTWVAIDSDSKLVLSYLIGDRSGISSLAFMQDLKGRLALKPNGQLLHRVQLTTDSFHSYQETVENVFGFSVDYAQLVKEHSKRGSKASDGDEAIESMKKTVMETRTLIGNPDPAHISTSYVERQNLSMRMGMRRFTRKTNAFSKRLRNHIHMCSLYFLHFNFCRIHSSLRVTPAMEAGVDDKLRDLGWIIDLIDDRAPKPKRPSTYRKKGSETQSASGPVS